MPYSYDRRASTPATIVLPMTMTLRGKFRYDPFVADLDELKAKGVRFSFPGRNHPDIRQTAETNSAAHAKQMGDELALKYVREDRMGNHADVVAIIEWVDDEVSALETKYTAVVNTYHSDS